MNECNILIVDDDPGICTTLSDIFQLKGYNVATAGTGKEAIEKVKRSQFDITLLDLKLPDILGIDLITPFKEIQPDMSVIVVTGHSSIENTIQALNGGASGYLTKPFEMDLVLAMINKAFENQKLVWGKRETEEALRETTETAEMYLNISAELIFRLDSQGTITLLNENGHRLLGYNPGELIGKNWFDTCLLNEIRPKIWAVFQKLMNGDIANVTTYENPVITKNGEVRLLLWHNSLLKDKNGRINGILSSAQDITERKQAEEALQASQDYLDKIINSLASPIFVKDDKHKFCLVNNAFCSLLNLPVEKVIGTTGFEYFPEDQMKVFIAKDQEVFETGKENINEEFLTDGTGKIRTIVTQKTLYTDSVGSKFLVGVISDITERKKAVKETENLRDFYEEILNNVHDGIWVTDENELMIYFNPGMERIAGVEVKDVLGLSVIEDFPLETTNHFLNFYNKAKQEKKPQFYEAEVTTPAGRMTIQSGWLIPQFKDGRYSGILCTVQDITEKKHVEEALRESEDFLNRTGEIAKVGGWQLSPEFDKVLWTYTTGRIHELPDGYVPSLEEAIHYYHPDDQEHVRNCVRIAIEECKPFLFDTRLITAKGNLRWVRAIGKPTVSNDKCVRLSGTFQDITDEKQIRKAMSENEEKFRLMMVNSPDMIMLQGTDGAYQFVSPQSIDVVGYSPEEIEKINIFEFIHPDDLENVRSANQDAFSGEEIVNFKYRLVDRNGAVRWLDHTARPLIIEDNFIGVQSTIRNITERMQVEIELEKHQNHLEEIVDERTKELKLAQDQLMGQTRLAALGKIAGNISHELRNPMASMNNAAYILRLVITDPDPDVQQSIEIIETEIQNSTRIIEALLDFARSSPTIFDEGTDINEVIQTSLLALDVPENIQVKYEYDYNLGDFITDPHRLRSAVQNIILNGIQAMPEGGTLTVRTITTVNDEVQVIISDTGIGMSETILSNIFEPLFSTKAKGIGLGLSLSKTIIEAIGGRIAVESTEGEGSTFAITLPELTSQNEESASND
jgi:PAS domain S-box-containing protein